MLQILEVNVTGHQSFGSLVDDGQYGNEIRKVEPFPMDAQQVRVGSRLVGRGQPCFIVAEAGVNHNGDVNLGHKLIDSAAKARVDAVKFQSFVAEELVTPQAEKAQYQIRTTATGGQLEMLKKLQLSPEDQIELKSHCENVGILYLSTPYEKVSLDILDGLGVNAFKIASTDTTNTPFLRCVAEKGRPVILSTGMSTLGEVDEAMNVLTPLLKGKVILLHCTSEYPAPVDEANLRAINTLERAFACPVGFSDHTPGIRTSPWAVALGACVVEKHFTLDRTMNGPDHQASLPPNELAKLVETIRTLESALGDGVKRPTVSELHNKPRMQKSLVATCDIRAGEVIKYSDLACKRPGIGLPPSWLERVVGRVAAVDIPRNTLLSLSSTDWRD